MLVHTLPLCLAVLAAQARSKHGATHITVPARASNAGVPLEAFLSYSIEWAFFPDYAGNLTHPNTYSANLISNLAAYAGTKPYIRVGGSSQDHAVFDASLDVATIEEYDLTVSADQPTNITFGPKFFESYQLWPGARFIHGFNLGDNSTHARQALLASVPYACRALRGKFEDWELGNEPDFYTFPIAGSPIRPPGWNETSYVDEWLHWSRAIRQEMRKSCPRMASDRQYKFYAPSFAYFYPLLDPVSTWESGLNADNDVDKFVMHNYVGYASQPGITLQNSLMNHTFSTASLSKLVNVSQSLHALPDFPPDLPFVVGEGNSLAGQGEAGLSNTFGAALWGVDFSLLLASNNISRFHMHQGTNYRYQSWQPVETNRTSKGTKAPYYGNIAVSAFLGDLTKASHRPQVQNIPLQSEKQAAYAAFVHGELTKVMLINMQEYNATEGNNYTDDYPRGHQTFDVQLPRHCGGKFGTLQRLTANGSDAISGVTFDGYSYNYELDDGKPVLLSNVTRGERVRVSRRGSVKVEVPDSSAVMITF